VKGPISVTALLALVTLVAGCTSVTQGNPSTTRSTETTPGGSTSTSNSSTADDPLAGIDPCTLLGAAIISTNQLTQGQTRPEPGARTCSWDKNADSSGPGYTVSIGIYDHAGLDKLNATDFTVTDYPVGQHQGRLSKDPAGHTCAVSIGITGTTRVDVVGIDGGGRQEQACTVATLVAPSVEQKLPGGNG
jgi:uncharacterized protein DUF3558